MCSSDLDIDPLPRVERSPDPTDDFLLALSEAGKADYLVTGDKSGLLSSPVTKARGSYRRANSPRYSHEPPKYRCPVPLLSTTFRFYPPIFITAEQKNLFADPKSLRRKTAAVLSTPLLL